jgi:hypothetical protein
MVSIVLLSLPLLTALAAWGTAYLLIYSTLYPLKAFRVAGLSIQGFLPAYVQNNTAEMTSLLTQEIINHLQQEQITIDTTAVKPIIETHLDTYLRIRLKEKMPVIASFIGESTIVKLKDSMIDEIDALLPQVMASLVSTAISPAKIHSKVATVVAGITPDKLAQFVAPVLKYNRTRASLFFGLMGFFFGLLASALFYCFLPCS